jgi:hypothetical protein
MTMTQEMMTKGTRVFRAELSTAPCGVIEVIETTTIGALRKEIARVWLPILEDGDIIQIFETYLD